MAKKKPQHHTRSKVKHSDPVLLAIEKVGDCLMEENYDGAMAIIVSYADQLRPEVNPSNMVDYLDISDNTTERLHRSGVHTVSDLKRQTRSSLRGLKYIRGSDADDAEAGLLTIGYSLAGLD